MRCRPLVWSPRSLLPSRNARYRPSSTSTHAPLWTSSNAPNGLDSVKAKASKQGGQKEPRRNLTEQAMRDREDLLREFGLEMVPGTASQGTGADINKMGQLQITDANLSKRPHKTALVLYRAPASLTERDFLRILAPGKHIEGWKSQGGLEQSK